MSAASDYLEEQWMRYAFTTTAMGTRPTAWYLGLHVGDPGESGAAAEVSGSGYARTSCAFTQTGGEVANTGAITCPTVATTPYTVSHVSVWDAVSGGNLLYKGPLPIAKALAVGDALQWAVGELILTVG